MHENAHEVFVKHCSRHFSHGCRVLEVGPEAIPSCSRRHVGDRAVVWDTVDLQNLSPHQTYVACDPYHYPIATESYDVVFSTQVMEHVPMPWKWILELNRICKIEGKIITIIPVTWPYHECPQDCWRAYRDGLEALYAFAGLEVLACDTAAMRDDGIYDTYAIGVKAE